MFGLDDIALGLSAANSAKSLLGGMFGGGGKSQSDMMEEQVAWQYKMANRLPYEQVQGMRIAGLNPMLVATKGLPQGQQPTQNTQDDRQVSTARQAANSQTALAMSTAANQAAQAKLYETQAEKLRAETPGNDLYQENLASAAALNRQKAQSEVEQQGVSRSLMDLNYAQTTLAEAGVQLKDAEQTFVKWQSAVERMKAKGVQPLQIQQMKIERDTLEEQFKTARRKGEIDDTTFGKVMGYVEKFFSALPFSSHTTIPLRAR